MLSGVAMPARGPAGWSTIAPPAAVPLARRWFEAMGRQRRTEGLSQSNGLDGIRVAYHFTLFACCALLGLFVGGYVGFMDATTPAVDSPYSAAALATSDVQWNAMARQCSASHCPHGAATDSVQEPFLQRLAGGSAVDPGVYVVREAQAVREVVIQP